jgi:transposase
MLQRKYVRILTKQECLDLEGFVKYDSDSKRVKKAKSILYSSKHMTVQEISMLLFLSSRTVLNYINDFENEGLPFLDREEGSGRICKISEEIDLESIIQKAPRVTEDAPNQKGRWTLQDLQIYLQTKYHINVSCKTVLNELRRRDLASKRPKVTVNSPDPEFDRKKKKEMN